MLRIKNKLLVIFVALNLLCTGVAMFAIYSEMRPHFLEAVEYTLIDMSRFLASQMAAQAEKDGRLDPAYLRAAAENLTRTKFPVEVHRNRFDIGNRSQLRIYVTDAYGKVLFDSNNAENEGRDFSQWRDILLTLEGRYGARATRVNPNDPETSTHFIAAPILVGGQIVGAVSVGKEVRSVAGFLNYSRLKVILIFMITAILSLAVSIVAAAWIARPVVQLQDYVTSLNTERPKSYPPLPADEIGSLGAAFESIRKELEGKNYVEKYVHNLTHEIKAPLTAIIGAAELVTGPAVVEEDRKQLLLNIRSEALRLQDIAEKLLELASLEARDKSGTHESFDLHLLTEEVADSFEILLRLHNLSLVLEIPEGLTAQGERFLIWRALSNLIQNAIDFAPDGSTITVRANLQQGRTHIEVRDHGAGIPDYARARVTEKFFSLERPRTGKKSSGLGLSFVREVMRGHGGRFDLHSEAGTTTASLDWPSLTA